ncbi:hypothetical protein [Acidisoma silvae]|uniref:Uncharacterized protein n=1 Tax=Acidisoma silvae TaxID=2802396 RepID=A0A963YWZ9_9PROT|nr:hypothetical protein [Acidisoma silvae]MCB8878440.1 hypothetical protein [Acidisoma silvae]
MSLEREPDLVAALQAFRDAHGGLSEAHAVRALLILGLDAVAADARATP